jgi:catechol 2,3-dioxygenase-like lactoylglutathione lyase family enzyme
MPPVTVRYIVDDVDASIGFYRDPLGLEVEMQPAPGFAMLSRGALRLALNDPGGGGAARPMPDGRVPEPGGWNRVQLEVAGIGAEAVRERLEQLDADGLSGFVRAESRGRIEWTAYGTLLERDGNRSPRGARKGSTRAGAARTGSRCPCWTTPSGARSWM